MQRDFNTFVGVDLGGGKGKTTAVARLVKTEGGGIEVVEVGTARDGQDPWYDENLIDYLGIHKAGAVVAIDAPLTLPACVRCVEPVCPGMSVCEDPAIVWFRTAGEQLIADAALADRDQIAAVPANGKFTGERRYAAAPRRGKPTTTPYTQRATEVVLHKRFDILPRETLGQGMGPLTARAAHLVRALARHGYKHLDNLIEVYPKATIHQRFGKKIARQYRREVDTWDTRARVLEELRGELEFSPRSKTAREECLRNDHCFDAVICAYTAFLWAKEGWQLPAGSAKVYAVDGWIWAPGVQ